MSLKVESLEAFARDNIINKDLDFYLQITGLTNQQKIDLRKTIVTKYDIDPIALSRFLNTPTGEQFLERLGVMVSLPGGKNGKYLLRGALVQAALDQENGLSILNVLNLLATDVQLNIKEIFSFLDYQNRLDLATRTIISDGKTISREKAGQNVANDYAKIKDIRQPGDYGVKSVQRLQLYDGKQDRSFYVLVYLPQKWKEGKTPVVIVSHGLGSRPEDFSSLGEQLASYGYLVAIPQHPGSDYQQMEDMLGGYSRKLYNVEEFIDRPLDVSYLLDELEKWNQEKFQGRLELSCVFLNLTLNSLDY
ncbi:MAG: alpha/beta hydrolase [Chlorogloea purpurea SAG 13.99]|nr:alpha/beta hydrolase [Chlorogloea purpurea SAG 13.99]